MSIGCNSNATKKKKKSKECKEMKIVISFGLWIKIEKQNGKSDEPSVCKVWLHGYENENRFHSIFRARTIIILVIRSGGLVYAYTSLHCGAVDIIRFRLRPIAHVLNIVLYIL